MNEKKYYKLYSSIKSDICNGKLKPGDKLPSKRSVCVKLKISLTTANTAYQNLVSEGLVIAKERSGFFVSENGVFLPHHPSKFSQILDKPEKCEIPKGYLTTMRKILNEYPDIISVKPDLMGCLVLRKSIANFLYRYRNLNVSPDNILIGSGAEELYGKILLILGRDKTYAIEEPCYKKIERVYSDYGIKIQKLKMDKNGIIPSLLNECNADVLHVSPFHSYPSGITASSTVLKQYVKRTTQNRWLIEDDYDSEFYFGAIPETLVKTSDRVLYLNTFSKSISPSIRTGYLILPDSLATLYKENFSSYTCPVPVFEQYVLAKFIDDGLFERHLNKKRLQALKDSN